MKAIFVSFTFVILILFNGCREDKREEYVNANIDFAKVTLSDGDRRRLCIGDLLSKALGNIEFREFIKQESKSNINGANSELLLYNILYKKYNNSMTVIDLLEKCMSNYELVCYEHIDDFINDVRKDLSLVIKLPDIIPLDTWDINTVIPFLYVRTNSFSRSSNVTDTAGTWGLHPSGIVDFYFDKPKYFPLVLKSSEDYMILDGDNYLQNGVHISNYFDLNKNLKIENPNSEFEFDINTKIYYVYNINKLVRHLLTENNMFSDVIKEDYKYNENCFYACTDIEDRQLIMDTLFIHEQKRNDNWLKNYDYNSFFRYYGRSYLSDNLIPLLSRRISNSNINDFRILIGSFRIAQFFNVENVVNISLNRVYFNGKEYDLPGFSLKSNVIGLNSINAPGIILAEKFDYDNKINLAFHTLTIDSEVKVSQIPYEDVFYSHYFQLGWVKNYDLMCNKPSNNHGLHYLAFKCRY